MSHFTKFLLLFFTIFDLSFKFSPFLSTGKITGIILLLLLLLNKLGKNQVKKKELYIFLSYFFILIYLIFIYMINNMPETTIIARMIYYFLYSILMSILFSNVFTYKKEFMIVLSEVIFIQSCFVIFSWVSADYRFIIDQILVQTGNISLLSSERPPGLMNSAGAKASVILGIGSSFCLYLLGRAKKKTETIKYTIMLIVSVIATFIVGRTGLIVFLILIVTIFLQRNNKIIFSKNILITFATLLLAAGMALPLIPENMFETIQMKSDWVFDEFSEGLLQSETVVVLKNMSIRSLGTDTLIGTSKIRPLNGQHDSGYIQSYHSMGLVVSAIFYISIFIHFIMLVRSKENKIFFKNNKLLIIGLIIGVFVVEIKEPFILSYTYPFIIFTLLRIPHEG